MKYTYTMISSWRKTNYIEDPKIAKRIIWHKDIPKSEASNQKIPIGPNNRMIQRATLIKDIMIWAKEWFKETREAPHDLCTIKNCGIWIQVHKIGS